MFGPKHTVSGVFKASPTVCFRDRTRSFSSSSTKATVRSFQIYEKGMSMGYIQIFKYLNTKLAISCVLFNILLYTEMKLKKVSRNLTYTKRYKALDSHDQVKKRRLRSFLLSIMTILIGIHQPISHYTNNTNNRLRHYQIISFLFGIVSLRYLHLVIDHEEEEETEQRRLNKRIEDFSPSDCKLFFRFLKPELYLLVEVLRIPEEVKLGNRYKMGGEEVFLRGLYEICSGENQHLIDCNCLPTSVTGGGPAESGANAARWSEAIQRSFYNGWKSIHGLKHQTVDNAFGFTIDMFGPTSLRRNDLNLLYQSDINERMNQIQMNNEFQYVIFGDSAYHRQSHLRSYYKADRPEDGVVNFRNWNNSMKKVRISIEWNYGYAAALFKYIQNYRKFQLLKCPKRVARTYTVATILKNLHIGLYGNITSNYFSVELDGSRFIRAYINQDEYLFE